MQVRQTVLRRRSELVRLAGRRKPVLRPAAEVENMLREIAFVLHCTRRVKAELAADATARG